MSKKYKRVQTPRVALFLGAGASRAFDYPTTKEFLTAFARYVEERLARTHSWVLNGFSSALLKSRDSLDIEHLLRLMDELINLPSNSPFLREYIVGEFFPLKVGEKGRYTAIETWEQFLNICRLLKRHAISLLFTEYRFTENKLSEIINHYGRLFEDLTKFNTNNQLDVFTTNYDSVIEEFVDRTEKKVELIDGFIPTERSHKLLWRPEYAFKKGFSINDALKLRLFKLHGSLNWCRRSDKEIQKLVIEQEVRDLERFKTNVLIYPAQKTYEEEIPFKALFEYFGEASRTSRLFVVIGFSFRDDLINGIFLDHLRANPRHRLIVVSPNATKNVEENLLQGKNPKLGKKIARIDNEFGKDETFKAIRSAIVRFS